MPCRRKWQPTPVLLPRKPHGPRIPAGCSPWGHRVRDWRHLEWSALEQHNAFVLKVNNLFKSHNSSEPTNYCKWNQRNLLIYLFIKLICPLFNGWNFSNQNVLKYSFCTWVSYLAFYFKAISEIQRKFLWEANLPSGSPENLCKME